METSYRPSLRLIDPFFFLLKSKTKQYRGKKRRKKGKNSDFNQDSNPVPSAQRNLSLPLLYTTEEVTQVVGKVFNLFPFP